ncbi:MAG: ATP-dependent DNA helicase PcrA [Candidatus Niyogibacteria bacterium CG10_big_fil_rev_8_21_14_0_10_46_36]|uniref:DNA 3'-5' helicase n=1 Tax=Candidatus Niyogibacteria bacterium CG10_big_fil_rev_8_21_14_0_10_46_36 TaxID=1974726 RepID=A0A2H0TDG6_9BACT|nr:MAG: ATP-dependent DNA helicase PcrA [Candidatus Niyogibacteria bacterium CG10_big_fil_rev_8_21_14_0_10_46_36]
MNNTHHAEPASFNPAQKEAVQHTKGPLLILAGAGSGKTRVLTHRIAHIIQKGTPPHHVLAVTFTNKAAQEMKKRIHALLGAPPSPAGTPWIGTFHSLGGYILRNEFQRTRLPKHFSIFDEEDSLSLIKESIKELALDPKQFQPTRIRGFISQKKGELVTHDIFREESGEHYYTRIISTVWDLYEEKLRAQKGADFDDLLLLPVVLFREHPDIRDAYQKKWSYIHIDEYQDTNHAQYILAGILAKKHGNICVVGDIDQCIYSWRGADFRNILAFENDWPDGRVITLEENYRSTQIILDAANTVIEKNKHRRPKNLFTQKQGGEKIVLIPTPSEKDEARYVVESIRAVREKGLQLREIAVLMRTNFQSRILEEAFLESRIPYRLTGVKFFNRKEIKDILAYVKASLNRDDLVSVKRIINAPTRGIGPTLTLKILGGVPLKPREEEKRNAFVALLDEVKKTTTTLPPSKAFKTILKKTGYMNMWDEETEEGAMRIANLKELVSLATRYDTHNPETGMHALLEDAALMSEQDAIQEDEDAVHIMTVHAAKGLEFDQVFLVGLEDGLFPHIALAGENEEERGEEERRLFYVALTRARKKIVISFSLVRTIFGEKRVNAPSRFLSDIPGHLVENIMDTEGIIHYDL